MAKWGEGDPRWLVEERPDATNVNNWHWTEKNASDWSKDKLKELLVGLKIVGEQVTCEIIEISKCDGEATVNNRKAKLIVFYEWEITLKWKGSLKDGQETHTGTFKILNLSEEHELKDVDVYIECDTSGDASETVKEFLRIKGEECVKEQLGKYLKSLVEEFSKGLLLPTKDLSHPVIQLKQQTSERKEKVQDVVQMKSTVERTETSELHTTEIFKCRAEELYQTLTTQELIQAFTRSDCIVESKVGGKFELYGGNVHGCYTELVPNKLIRQQWRLKSWPNSHFSNVKIEIRETPDSTEVDVHQTGIPETELDNTRNGWKQYYWQSIKRVFGFGASLL